MRTRIVIDSTADMPEELKSRCAVVPLTVRFGSEEYVDGVTIDYKTFYEKLVETDVLPTTSQASPDAFAGVYREAAAAGEEVVVITVSSSLSGTCQSALIAAADFDNVHVVDSRSAAIGTGILAELALRLVDGGMGAADVAARLEEERNNICLVAMVDTLEYLKKGGRLSAAAAVVGGLLNIKPVIALEEGEIVVLGKARGSRQGNNLLASVIQKAGGVDFAKPVLLGYTGLSDALLVKYIEDSRAIWEEGGERPRYVPIGSVIGTHAGPGAVAAAFFKK